MAHEHAAGTAEGAPEVLAVGLVGYDELAVAAWRNRSNGPSSADQPASVGRGGQSASRSSLEDLPLLALDVTGTTSSGQCALTSLTGASR